MGPVYSKAVRWRYKSPADTPRERLARKLQRARLDRQIPQKAVSDYLGLSQSAFSRIECGDAAVALVHLARLVVLYQWGAREVFEAVIDHADLSDAHLEDPLFAAAGIRDGRKRADRRP